MTPNAALRYCPDLLNYTRRRSREVMVGNVGVGGSNPIRVQSMITSDTRDTPACVAETLALAEAGCEIVRITAQTKVYAANLENIAREVRAAGCEVPLVADIHFKPDAAMEAAKWVEKVRVNPGNYADKKKFEIREYSDDQYEAELERIREQFTPLVHLCKDLGSAMRIGTNHGSLSDRIMNRYGDTPLGMCESAFEFARIARENDYHNFVFSMKASNPKVMIEAYRLLVARLHAEGEDWNYPIHLGVTEAGDGEDGRIKSAIGIGSLLADGIGDTIRVSLTEDAVHEIPVAKALVELQSSGSSCCVSQQAVEAASRSFPEDAQNIRINWDKVQKDDATFLPHWKMDGGTYAVTFRQADALPASALTKYREARDLILEKIEILKNLESSRSQLDQLKELRDELSHIQTTFIEPALDQGHGTCLLKDPENAKLIQNALTHFDGKRYDLLSWCVMPNHVHVVLTTYPGEALEKILHSWKSFTSHEVNKRNKTSETIWQKESYDHLVRDEEDLRNQVEYVLNNPAKAGLGDWEWVGSAYAGLSAGRREHGLPRDAAATLAPSFDPFTYQKRGSQQITIQDHDLGGDKPVRVFTTQERWNAVGAQDRSNGRFQAGDCLGKIGHSGNRST